MTLLILYFELFVGNKSSQDVRTEIIYLSPCVKCIRDSKYYISLRPEIARINLFDLTVIVDNLKLLQVSLIQVQFS